MMHRGILYVFVIMLFVGCGKPNNCGDKMAFPEAPPCGSSALSPAATCLDQFMPEKCVEGIRFSRYKTLSHDGMSFDRYWGIKNDTIYVLAEKYLQRECVKPFQFAVIPRHPGMEISYELRDQGCNGIPSLYYDRPIQIYCNRVSLDELRVLHEMRYDGLGSKEVPSTNESVLIFEITISFDMGITTFQKLSSDETLAIEWY